MKKMLFIYNPKAGKAQIRNKLADILDVFTKGDYEITVYPTQKSEDAMEKTRDRSKDYDIVVCSGGDGTLDEVVTGMIRSGFRTPIGYIPAGSTNDFANSLFMPKSMTDAASMIMEEKLYHCDIGRFNNQSFTYIAAFGLFTDVAYQTDQDLKNILGHVAYLLEGVKRLFDIKSYHMRIESEELTVEDDFIFGMITNSRSVGGFKNLTGKNVDMNDGLFEVTMITRPKNPLELQEIMTAMLTAEDNTDLIHSFKSARVTITSEEPVPWTLDGEYGGSHTQIEIENCHEALNLYLKSTKNEETRSIGISPLINKKEK